MPTKEPKTLAMSRFVLSKSHSLNGGFHPFLDLDRCRAEESPCFALSISHPLNIRNGELVIVLSRGLALGGSFGEVDDVKENSQCYNRCMPIVFSEHAKEQLRDRGISKKAVLTVIERPKVILTTYRGRKLRQRRVGGKLLEAVTKTEGSRITVITAYILEE